MSEEILFINRIGAFSNELSFDSSMSISGSFCDCLVPVPCLVPAIDWPWLSMHWMEERMLSCELAKRIMKGLSVGLNS